MKIAPHKTTKRLKLRTLSLLLALTVLAAGCSQAADKTEETAQSASTVKTMIKVEEVGKHSMGEPREGVAEVSASVKLDITAKTSGTIVSLIKKNGALVKKGDVIARLDARAAQLEKEKAVLALSSAKQSMAGAAAEFKANRLKMVNSIKQLEDQLKQQTRQDETVMEETKRNLDIARQQLAALDETSPVSSHESSVASAKLSLETAELALEQYNIVAPASGLLSDIKLQAGADVSPGTIVGSVHNTDKVSLKASLTAATADLARNKSDLIYYASGNESVQKKAQVVHIGALPDPTTRLYALELEADNGDGMLKAGSRVHIQLTTPEEEVVTAIPSLSIIREGDAAYVFVLSGGKAAKRTITLGRINDTFQEVLTGLKVGEQLVTSGQQSLKDGQAVEASQLEKQQ
ncbi:efflux RND transporter periplasmic adaptor subunit [Paenibacillus oenotherae]|nr:efflux RND transporter periplasmic adaptor subunit [Paenibacillus oenotherae]